jgi:hypothetical protein
MEYLYFNNHLGWEVTTRASVFTSMVLGITSYGNGTLSDKFQEHLHLELLCDLRKYSLPIVEDLIDRRNEEKINTLMTKLSNTIDTAINEGVFVDNISIKLKSDFEDLQEVMNYFMAGKS